MTKIFAGDSDCSMHIQTRIGKRFLVIKDNLCGHVGLYDFHFLGRTIMANCEEEKLANVKVIEKARGDVLIAGLGIGLIVLPIMKKENVTSVDIIEKYQEVIDLIKPQLPLNNKVTIIHQDIMDFIPAKKYDLIYMDTLPEIQYLEDEKKARTRNGKFITDTELAEEFKKYLKGGGEALCYHG